MTVSLADGDQHPGLKLELLVVALRTGHRALAARVDLTVGRAAVVA